MFLLRDQKRYKTNNELLFEISNSGKEKWNILVCFSAAHYSDYSFFYCIDIKH